MIDKRPALIVRPTGAADVIDAVNLARENGLPLAVRCGGHSVAGQGVVDDGILIDLSSLKGVRVDPTSRRARTNAGALWGEFDRETQLFGLATPGGRVTTTGVGGFTLGGGYGWLSPKWGLTCDNLTSVDVVTADGRLVTASEEENEDLFWGVRGGSGNFGVVTSYEFRLHQLGPIVLAGLLLHPIDDAKSVIRGYRDYVETAPEELATGTVILQAPPAPFIPEHLHGKPALGIAAMYIGDADEGRDVVAPLKELGPPAVDMIQPMPYTAFQALLDPFNQQGLLIYTRGMHLS
jgi:FAD/FMN-containing dehydrogenase